MNYIFRKHHSFQLQKALKKLQKSSHKSFIISTVPLPTSNEPTSKAPKKFITLVINRPLRSPQSPQKLYQITAFIQSSLRQTIFQLKRIFIRN